MITLIISLCQGVDFGVILGYVLSGCEVLIVALTLISFFVKPDSKFGKVLSHILKGLYAAKSYTAQIKAEEEEKEEEIDDTTNNNEDDNCPRK